MWNFSRCPKLSEATRPRGESAVETGGSVERTKGGKSQAERKGHRQGWGFIVSLSGARSLAGVTRVPLAAGSYRRQRPIPTTLCRTHPSGARADFGRERKAVV